MDIHLAADSKDHVVLLIMQELATVFIENLNVKVLLINNQHLGMVMQWEDRFYKVRFEYFIGISSSKLING